MISSLYARGQNCKINCSAAGTGHAIKGIYYFKVLIYVTGCPVDIDACPFSSHTLDTMFHKYTVSSPLGCTYHIDIFVIIIIDISKKILFYTNVCS